MIVNTNSILHKTFEFCCEKTGHDETTPGTLCHYFWKWWGMLGFFSILYFIVIPFAIYCILVDPLLYLAMSMINSTWLEPGFATLFGLGAWGLLLFACLLAFVSVNWDDSEHNLHKLESNLELNRVNFIFAHLRAMKNKVCPIIEYK